MMSSSSERFVAYLSASESETAGERMQAIETCLFLSRIKMERANALPSVATRILADGAHDVVEARDALDRDVVAGRELDHALRGRHARLRVKVEGRDDAGATEEPLLVLGDHLDLVLEQHAREVTEGLVVRRAV